MRDVFDSSANCLALVACDTVITDAATGKKSLIGIFNSIGAVNYPHTMPQFFIFASLTNILGDAEISVRLISPDAEEIFNLKGKVPIKTALDTPEIIFNIQNLSVKNEGGYELQLAVEGSLIASRPLLFKRIKTPIPPHSQG